MFDDHAFALCLTHDVDRPYKTYQSLYYALSEGRLDHLVDVRPGRNPYWQFEEIAELEADLGVRSAFYFLNEPHILRKGARALLRPDEWVEHLGRYDIRDPEVVEAMRRLDDGGWEIGLHGSYDSCDDVDRLRREKAVLEECLGAPVVGGRQHHLKVDVPETWRHHAEIGLRYDASLGSGKTYGFQYGYDPIRPLNDEFVVFPLTVMEQALPDPSTRFEEAWAACEDLLAEAAEHDAVMTALWHPRYFSETDFPGYRRLYRRLVQRALAMGAWVGSPAECYRELDGERTPIGGTLV